MGIKGLWKELQSVCSVSHISQFRGQRVAVDGYCWLHRAAIASVIPLATGQPCDRFIQFFLARVELLQKFGVIPVIVFDGNSMPMKAGTNAARAERREAARRDGLVLLANGRREEAQHVLEKAVTITSEIAYACISILKRRNVEVVVAPYEADAQLAYLCKEGHVQAVISEDSDLVVYGCGILIAKLDGQGNCDVLRCRDLPQVQIFSSLSYEKFVWVCIMSGCDYLNSLSGVGIKTACKAVSSFASGGAASSSAAASTSTLSAVMKYFQTQHGFHSREMQAYEDGFHKAFYCFAHHLVYDPFKKKIVPFTPLPKGVQLRADLIGTVMPDDLAVQVCGDATVDPHTKQPYKGDQAESVRLFLRRSGGTQKTLEEMGLKRNPIKTEQQHQKTATGVRTVDVNTGWRSRQGKDMPSMVSSSAAQQQQQQPQEPKEVVYYRSKYFPVATTGDENSSNSQKQALLPPMVDDDPTDSQVMREHNRMLFEAEDGAAGGHACCGEQEEETQEGEQQETTSPGMLAVLNAEPLLGDREDDDEEEKVFIFEEAENVNQKPSSHNAVDEVDDEIPLLGDDPLDATRPHRRSDNNNSAKMAQASSSTLDEGSSTQIPQSSTTREVNASGEVPPLNLLTTSSVSQTADQLRDMNSVLFSAPATVARKSVTAGGGDSSTSASVSQQQLSVSTGVLLTGESSGKPRMSLSDSQQNIVTQQSVGNGASKKITVARPASLATPRQRMVGSGTPMLLAAATTATVGSSSQQELAITRQKRERMTITLDEDESEVEEVEEVVAKKSNIDVEEEEEMFPMSDRHAAKTVNSALSVAGRSKDVRMLAFAGKGKIVGGAPSSTQQGSSLKIQQSSSHNPFASFAAKKK